MPKEKEAKNKQRSCGERPRILANVVYFEECGFSDCGYTTAILGMVDFFGAGNVCAAIGGVGGRGPLSSRRRSNRDRLGSSSWVQSTTHVRYRKRDCSKSAGPPSSPIN